jgi:hypothetical protein
MRQPAPAPAQMIAGSHRAIPTPGPGAGRRHVHVSERVDGPKVISRDITHSLAPDGGVTKKHRPYNSFHNGDRFVADQFNAVDWRRL